MIKMTVSELRQKLSDITDQEREVSLVFIDEQGTKRVGIIDFGMDENGVYLTGVTTDAPYIYKCE